MKRIFFNIEYIVVLLTMISLSSCKKELDALSPHNVNFEGQQFSSPAGYTKATIGNYTALYDDYESSWYNISEFRGNNVKIIDVTSVQSKINAQNIDAFNFTNADSKDFGLSHTFWFASYRALLGINLVLKNIAPTESNPVILQAKAENLFLRAFVNFNLVRVYGRPYDQSPETNLGIPLILEPLDLNSVPPARATVKDTYAQIIADLNNSIAYFNSKGVNSFANKYAAFALLSRVYLYMSSTFNQPNTVNARLAIQAADSVIVKGGYHLLQGNAYATYYSANNQSNTETIWALNHDAFQTTLPALLMQPQGGSVGIYSMGQVKPSPNLISLLQNGDLRKRFYYTDAYPGNTTDLLSTGKFLYGYINGSSAAATSKAPFHHLRLAEVYLNRAEAKLKNGEDAAALSDLNVIHERAGLTKLSGLTGSALFDAILLERRLELAFEGHNSYDYFRNGQPMVRNYDSFNSPALTINANDPRVILRISQDVLNENRNVTQNIQ